jgi:hypothetical protein
MARIAVVIGLLMVVFPFVPSAYCYLLRQICEITLLSAASLLLIPVGCVLVAFGGVAALGPDE